MFKCEKCLFYNEYQFRDMGAIVPGCDLFLEIEKIKKENNKPYDLFSSLNCDEIECSYYENKKQYLRDKALLIYNKNI